MTTKKSIHLVLRYTQIHFLGLIILQIFINCNFINAQSFYDDECGKEKVLKKYPLIKSSIIKPFFQIREQSSLNTFDLIKPSQDYNIKERTIFMDENSIYNRKNEIIESYPKGQNYKSRLSAGLGLTYLTKSPTPHRILFSLNTYFNLRFITKYLYLGVGTDVFPEPKYALATRITFYIIPTLGVNIFKEKFSVFIGGGAYLYHISIGGWVISLRSEYNINKLFSVGFEIKHPDFGDQEFSTQSLYLMDFYFAFKF